MLRPLTAPDLHAVIDVWNRALRRDPMNVARFIGSVLCDPDYWPGDDSGFFVAVQGDRVLGFVRAIVRRHSNDRVGVEPENGWIPVIAVDPQHQRRGIGGELLAAAEEYLRKHGRKRVWVCGNTGSAPGYVFPGVDQDAYARGLEFFLAAGYHVDHEPVAMSREIVRFELEEFERDAWSVGRDLRISSLTTERIQDLFAVLAEAFPGDWNTAARAKVRSGALHEVLIAEQGTRIVGYCQWEGEHFGPFGVRAESRNAKIGAKLFVEAVRRIRQADGRTVWFNWADEAAARFYARFGLKNTRRFAILRKDL